MNRFLAAVVVAALAASAAVADIPPPPPPKGKKYVTVNNEVVLGKDVTGYVFVQQSVTGPGRPVVTFSKLDLTPGKAKALPAGGRRNYVTLFAVPADAAKEFKTDADLFDALKANKVKGVHNIGFGGTATVSDAVKGDSVKWTTTITAVGEKGITKKPMAWYLYLKSMNRKIITMVQAKKTTDSNRLESGAWPCPMS